MPRFSTLLVALSFAFADGLFAQYTPPDPTGLEGIIVETYYIADADDADDTDGGPDLDPAEVTYRVFVDMKEGYKLLTTGGFPLHDITFATTTSFFYNDDRGESWGEDIDHTHLDDNTVAIDSWLSAGAASDIHWGVMKDEDTDGSIVGGPNNDGGSNGVPGGLLVNNVPGMGLPLTTADGLLDTGTPAPASVSLGAPPTMFDGPGSNTYASDNFAWTVLGGVEGPTPENKVLIGQFTTDGTFSFCLNLWVKIPDSLVCPDPNCHEYMEFYAVLLPSDTAGGGFTTDNKFTLPSLCFTSSSQQLDCLGVPGGPALPGTACDDGNVDTANDVYDANCVCVGEDCLGVLGGNALPGQPCDDNDPGTVDDTWLTGCSCVGTPVGIDEPTGSSASMSVYPNPAGDLVWIEITDALGARASYELKDALGNVVARQDLGNLSGRWKGSMDLSDLGSGVYFLELTVGTQKYLDRLTKY